MLQLAAAVRGLASNSLSFIHLCTARCRRAGLDASQTGVLKDSLYAKIPQRLTVSMRGLLRSNPMASHCVFLGFTKTGEHLCTGMW